MPTSLALVLSVDAIVFALLGTAIWQSRKPYASAEERATDLMAVLMVLGMLSVAMLLPLAAL